MFFCRSTSIARLFPVGDQDVPVSQKLGGVGAIQLIGTGAGHAGRTVLPRDLVGRDRDLDDPVVRLIGDQDGPRGQVGGLNGSVQLIPIPTRDAELAVLPDDAPFPDPLRFHGCMK